MNKPITALSRDRGTKREVIKGHAFSETWMTQRYSIDGKRVSREAYFRRYRDLKELESLSHTTDETDTLFAELGFPSFTVAGSK